jgi:integrase
VNGYKRCRCRDETGKALEAHCPKLRRTNGSWNPAHGTWYGKAELAPTPDGDRVILKAGGFRTEADMEAWFAEAVRLAAIPEDGPAGHEERMQILALIRESRRRKAALPSYDDMARRSRHGAAFSAGTAGEYLLGWIEAGRRAGDLTTRTIRGYDTHIRLYFLPAFGDVPLDKLRLAHVEKAFALIDAENDRIAAAQASDDPAVRASVRGQRLVGPATKQRIKATLRSALGVAEDQKLITTNVAKSLRLASGKAPKARVWTAARLAAWESGYQDRLAEVDARLRRGPGRPSSRGNASDPAPGRSTRKERFLAWHEMASRPSPVMVWTPAQTGAFLDSVSGHRLYPLFHLIAYRGLRRGEACGVRWADTDLDAGTMTILTQLVQDGWDVDEDTPKTEASDATIALDAGTVRVLRAWKARCAAEELAWRDAWTKSDRVFCRQGGGDLHPGWVTEAFESLAFDAGLPPIRLHDLRHSAASMALATGAEMKEVSALLRHSSTTITADIYTSVLPDLASELAEKMAAMIPRKAAVGGPSETAGPPSVPQEGPQRLRIVRDEK